MKKLSLISTALLTLMLAATPALASPTGVIIGAIKDQSGAAISGAQITLVRTDTNTRLTAKTDANGAYQFPQLPPANYALTVEAIGFKKVTVGTVVVQVDQITRVDLALEVGAVTEADSLEADLPLLVEAGGQVRLPVQPGGLVRAVREPAGVPDVVHRAGPEPRESRLQVDLQHVHAILHAG